jgi:hypothetical protein
MRLSLSLLCSAGLALLATWAGCDGKTLHLGNGRGAADAGDAGDGAACPHAQISGAKVLWIGDTWAYFPGEQNTVVRDRARALGAIGAADEYIIAAQGAQTMAQIATQYDNQKAGAPKVIIMDGGTWDTIQSNGAAATVTSVVDTFTQFLVNVHNDGTVEHVVYFLCPESAAIPGVAALRTPLQSACAQSQVPCHFLDLQATWAGHSDYNTTGAIPIPTDAGATAIGNAIWAKMQQDCIEQ